LMEYMAVDPTALARCRAFFGRARGGAWHVFQSLRQFAEFFKRLQTLTDAHL